MDKNSTIGTLFEQGKTALDDSATNVIDTTKKQVIGNQGSTASTNLQNENVKAQLSDESREIVEDFYSPTVADQKSPQAAEDTNQRLENIRGELARLQKSLHQTEYYDPLFAYEKKRKQEAQADVVQDQEEENGKMDELRQAEKKKQDLAKFRAERSTEIKGGVAG